MVGRDEFVPEVSLQCCPRDTLLNYTLRVEKGSLSGIALEGSFCCTAVSFHLASSSSGLAPPKQSIETIYGYSLILKLVISFIINWSIFRVRYLSFQIGLLWIPLNAWKTREKKLAWGLTMLKTRDPVAITVDILQAVDSFAEGTVA